MIVMWRSFRIVIGLQTLSTVVAALLSAWLSGVHGAISSALGGSVGIAAGLVFAVLASGSKSKSAGEALISALKAEAIKVAIMISLLGLVWMTYKDVVAVWLIGTFILSTVIFSSAVFVREHRR